MARGWALTIGVLGALALTGCSQTTSGVGPVGFAAPETASGGVAGNLIGTSLDATSLRKARQAELRALESGRTGVPIGWNNGRVRGEVVPGAQYQVNTYNCRDYTHTIYGTGQPQTARGTSCRQPDGAWQFVS